MVRAGAEKSPGESDQTFAGVGLGTRAVAGGNGDQIGVQRMLDYVARVEFVGIAFGGKNDRGFERTCATGRPMRGEMQIREFFGLAGASDREYML